MPRYDPERLVRVVSELHRAVERLRKLAQLNAPDFADDPDTEGP